jgi:hypothetical protein
MMKCSGWIVPQPDAELGSALPPLVALLAQFVRSWRHGRACQAPAIFLTCVGPRCASCAEKVIDAVMSDDTALGMAARARGWRPESRELARATLLRGIS